MEPALELQCDSGEATNVVRTSREPRVRGIRVKRHTKPQPLQQAGDITLTVHLRTCQFAVRFTDSLPQDGWLHDSMLPWLCIGPIPTSVASPELERDMAATNSPLRILYAFYTRTCENLPNVNLISCFKFSWFMTPHKKFLTTKISQYTVVTGGQHNSLGVPHNTERDLAILRLSGTDRW